MVPVSPENQPTTTDYSSRRGSRRAPSAVRPKTGTEGAPIRMPRASGTYVLGALWRARSIPVCNRPGLYRFAVGVFACRLRCADPHQSPIWIKTVFRSDAGLAPDACASHKTVGTRLPPQGAHSGLWLPVIGSRPSVADSRGEPVQPGDGAALHSGLVVRPTPWLARDPVAISEGALDVEGDVVAHDVEARAGELVRDGPDRHDAVGARSARPRHGPSTDTGCPPGARLRPCACRSSAFHSSRSGNTMRIGRA